MKKVITWFSDLFDKESNVSSKRFAGITLLVWSMVMGSYYIIKVQLGGVESNTSVSLLEFAVVSGVGLLAGGTVAEQVGSSINNRKKSKEKPNSKNMLDE